MKFTLQNASCNKERLREKGYEYYLSIKVGPQRIEIWVCEGYKTRFGFKHDSIEDDRTLHSDYETYQYPEVP